MEVSDQLHASDNSLPEGNSLKYPVDRRLGGSQTQSVRCGEGISLLQLLEIKPVTPSVQPYPVTQYSAQYAELPCCFTKKQMHAAQYSELPCCFTKK
jgi:hypothetical protein